MAAFAASARWNPALMALYQRLRARGRSHKATVVACARKLLIYANTVVQRDTPSPRSGAQRPLPPLRAVPPWYVKMAPRA